ncbi:DUF6338 family protein [Micromonospora avicenniae]|uniref:Uncharacterized protein n=1 Tax=Micromonospora avicenniae TaxID=1198245 RepID=A0A1N6ZWQ7_9ACTN|nr:DUF6338 family protein [Micromonospora avicenniae]SIR31240.1 hypothetical protein SAMN05444858_108141 [Micromonospora avicenniae]
MPTTVLGVVIFVGLLLPGYLYERRRERDIPQRTRSPLRETMSVLFVGVSADVVTGLILALAWSTLPVRAPDLAALLRTPREYLIAGPWLVVGWAAAGLAFACLSAYLVAARPWHRWLRRRTRFGKLLRHAEPQQSSWWLLLREHPDLPKYVGCYLDDGSYVAGRLHSFSRVSDETADRDLSLRHDPEHPLVYRPKGADQTYPLTNIGAVAISARRIVLLTVTYREAPPPVSTESAKFPAQATPTAQE